MPASPASRAASWQSRSTNSSGWRCSHIRRTSPRSSSTSQSSRIGGTVMYSRPYSATISSQWSSMVTDTVAPSSASSSRRRIRSAAPKKRPSASAPGSAISRSRFRRTRSSSASPGPGSATGMATPAGWSAWPAPVTAPAASGGAGTACGRAGTACGGAGAATRAGPVPASVRVPAPAPVRDPVPAAPGTKAGARCVRPHRHCPG